MRLFARFLAILAVAIVAAQPVMACCLAGHAEAQIAQMSAEPPCHGDTHDAAPGAQTDAHDLANPRDCPGCPDCDRAAIGAQNFDDQAVLATGPSETPAGETATDFAGFEPRRVVLTTGPPRDPPLLHSSPVTLKQRLLN